ncbi:putative transcription factor bHLH family [Medicago truncatula]|uniref:BHLH transcription factor-like protein n=1 Tax=Medicago truncatula TaxID=3880 RepID=A0A072TR48_MEDTR|nr:transcription factor bHLH123 isoform X1 [Medicago truncatula]KEH19696.1 BHLH transcription factor-like protein [Medicago truncatula]RHN41018.1 putative transcription factor bHLH family [Medicago truncatula]
MAEEQFQASGNWWETPARNMRFESVEQQQQQSSSFGGWQQQQQHHDTMSASGSSSVVFHDTTQKLQPSDSSTSNNDSNLHMMGLGLSSQNIDWNQASILRNEKASEGSFRSMLQENLNSTGTNFEQETSGIGIGVELSHQVNWRQEKLFSNESSSNEFKQVNRGFSLDQPQFSPQYSSGDSNMISQMDSSALYGNPSMLQGLLGTETNQIQPQHGNSFENRSMNFPYSSTSYGLSTNELIPSWSKVSHQNQKQHQQPNNQLHFTNNAPFWNASETTIKDASSSFLPPFTTPNFGAQTKNISEGRDSSAMVKKSGSEPAPKRSKNETPSPLPAFKVRKEKMGDRITALQQLVSPFGKTDTASVLSEAIEYIKFLHEQVTVLSTPYMKSGAPIQHQQSSGKSKEADGPKQDLRSRGLCLVPVSSTFPMTHEPTVEYWTPTFGGTFR